MVICSSDLPTRAPPRCWGSSREMEPGPHLPCPRTSGSHQMVLEEVGGQCLTALPGHGSPLPPVNKCQVMMRSNHQRLDCGICLLTTPTPYLPPSFLPPHHSAVQTSAGLVSIKPESHPVLRLRGLCGYPLTQEQPWSSQQQGTPHPVSSPDHTTLAMFASLLFLQLTNPGLQPRTFTSCHSVQDDHRARSTTPRVFLRCGLLGEAFPIHPVNDCDLPSLTPDLFPRRRHG